MSTAEALQRIKYELGLPTPRSPGNSGRPFAAAFTEAELEAIPDNASRGDVCDVCGAPVADASDGAFAWAVWSSGPRTLHAAGVVFVHRVPDVCLDTYETAIEALDARVRLGWQHPPSDQGYLEQWLERMEATYDVTSAEKAYVRDRCEGFWHPRTAAEKLALLRQAIAEGEASGDPQPGDEVFARVRERAGLRKPGD